VEVPEILIEEAVIAGRVGELAERISRDYAGEELVLVCILKGALIFTADLMRKVTIPVSVEFLQAASYGASTFSSKSIVIRKDLESDIKGKHVLLLDAIIDTGETMDFLLRKLSDKDPASIRAAALLDKKSRRITDVPVAYIGFEIPDKFVVGYGMDFGERYRNFPFIAELKTTSA